jgi:chloride channel 2
VSRITPHKPLARSNRVAPALHHLPTPHSHSHPVISKVTSTYFAVRNYWRGFYASVIGALIFRLLAVAYTDESTITALFSTKFDEYPFDLGEMIAFTVLGAISGILAALFVYSHRRLVEVNRRLSKPGHALEFLNRSLCVKEPIGAVPISRLHALSSASPPPPSHLHLFSYLYPFLATFIIATLSFPKLFGSYMGLVQRQEIEHLFTARPLHCVPEWSHSNIFGSLFLFCILKFAMTVLAITLPIPAGVFVPVFVIGAGFGRFAGELMSFWFPRGLRGGAQMAWLHDVVNTTTVESGGCGWHSVHHVVPGGYAVVGAAAFAGGVTHTISTSVIVFELTGQIHHILPVMVAVLISNAVCQMLSPSIYDSIIQLRGMPYLPDLRRGLAYKKVRGKIVIRVEKGWALRLTPAMTAANATQPCSQPPLGLADAGRVYEHGPADSDPPLLLRPDQSAFEAVPPSLLSARRFRQYVRQVGDSVNGRRCASSNLPSPLLLRQHDAAGQRPQKCARGQTL